MMGVLQMEQLVRGGVDVGPGLVSTSPAKSIRPASQRHEFCGWPGEKTSDWGFLSGARESIANLPGRMVQMPTRA